MSLLEMIAPPEIITTNGHLIDYLFNYTTVMNIIFFTLVCVGLFGFSYLYHHKRSPKGEYTYGNKKKQQAIIGYLIGASVFLLIDLNITRISNNDMLNEFWNFPKEDEDIIRVEVLAQQWMWNFRMAGKDGEFNTADDVLSNHTLNIPVGKKVEFRLTSKDVIHSFFIPNTRLKVDAMPGRISRMWFEPTKTGKYAIACAEMCGTHHYLMMGELVVHEQAVFDEWYNEAQHLADIGNDNDNIDNFWGWKWESQQ